MNPSLSVASSLHPHQRQQLAVQVLSKQEPIRHIAHQEQGASEIPLPTESDRSTSLKYRF